MRKARRVLAAGALAATTTVGALALPAAVANADSGTWWTYQATLNPLNHATGSGMLTLKLSGNQAKVTEHWSGLAASFSGAAYPHVQHIHIDGAGTCPSTSADANGDGVVSTTEGHAAYGMIGATLSVSGDASAKAALNVKTAPSGASTDYSRTITLDSKTAAAVKNGTAVIVVHGLDPSTLSKKAQGEKSDLTPDLPLAATSPALCGPLSAMPASGPNTGSGSTAGTQNGGSNSGLQNGLFAFGGLLLAAAGGGLVALRRRTGQTVRSARH